MSTQVAVSETITAPIHTVFNAVADVRTLPDHNADVVAVELLTDGPPQCGTRFRETRRMKGKDTITELEITEWVDDARVRMVTEVHGTVWDTVFEVRPRGVQTELVITMDARAQSRFQRAFIWLMQGVFRRGIEKHLRALKATLERA